MATFSARRAKVDRVQAAAKAARQAKTTSDVELAERLHQMIIGGPTPTSAPAAAPTATPAAVVARAGDELGGGAGAPGPPAAEGERPTFQSSSLPPAPPSANRGPLPSLPPRPSDGAVAAPSRDGAAGAAGAAPPPAGPAIVVPPPSYGDVSAPSHDDAAGAAPPAAGSVVAVPSYHDMMPTAAAPMATPSYNDMMAEGAVQEGQKLPADPGQAFVAAFHGKEGEGGGGGRKFGGGLKPVAPAPPESCSPEREIPSAATAGGAHGVVESPFRFDSVVRVLGVDDPEVNGKLLTVIGFEPDSGGGAGGSAGTVVLQRKGQVVRVSASHVYNVV